MVEVSLNCYRIKRGIYSIRGRRGQNSVGSRLVTGLESAVAARISRCN